MDSGTCGIDPIKIQAIRHCLEKQFANVTFSQKIRPTFVFHHGVEKQSWHVVFNEQFLANHMAIEELEHFVEQGDLKGPQESRKRIQISKFGDITVEEKNPS